MGGWQCSFSLGVYGTKLNSTNIRSRITIIEKEREWTKNRLNPNVYIEDLSVFPKTFPIHSYRKLKFIWYLHIYAYLLIALHQTNNHIQKLASWIYLPTTMQCIAYELQYHIAHYIFVEHILLKISSESVHYGN